MMWYIRFIVITACVLAMLGYTTYIAWKNHYDDLVEWDKEFDRDCSKAYTEFENEFNQGHGPTDGQ